MILRSSLMSLAAISALTSAAAAQTAASSADEVVVTAQKREQALQDVPASVAAVSQDALLDAGVVDQSQLTKLVPGLVVGRQATTGFAFIRGVGQPLGSPNLQPAISINLNG